METLRSFERGIRRPSRAMAQRLADVLDVPVDERARFLRLARAATADTPATHQGQPDQPPPPDARAKSQPPTLRLDLIGRTAERERLLSLLQAPGPRLITLIGPGGIGKTTLALQIAAGDPGFLGGFFYYQLTGVLIAFMSALTFPESTATCRRVFRAPRLRGAHDDEHFVASCWPPSRLEVKEDRF